MSAADHKLAATGEFSKPRQPLDWNPAKMREAINLKLLAHCMAHIATKSAGVNLTDSENRAVAADILYMNETEAESESVPKSSHSDEMTPRKVSDSSIKTGEEGEASGDAATVPKGETAKSADEASQSDSTTDNSSPLKQFALAILNARLSMLQRIMDVLQKDVVVLNNLAKVQQEKRRRLKLRIQDQQQFSEMNQYLYTIEHAGLLELRERIETLNSTSPDGSFVWVITDIANKRKEALENTHLSFYSHPFYVHRYGYKLCLRMYLNGDGLGKGNHVSLYLAVMKSPWDNILRWPFQQKITLILYDQNFKEHVIDAFRPDVTVESFKKPETNMNVASGSSLFMPLMILNSEDNKISKYIVNDTMILKVIVDISDLASLKWVPP